jgi:hypothetical protein
MKIICLFVFRNSRVSKKWDWKNTQDILSIMENDTEASDLEPKGQGIESIHDSPGTSQRTPKSKTPLPLRTTLIIKGGPRLPL